MPSKQPKKARLWLNDGSCVRLRPDRPNHVRSYDFVEDRTHDGRKFRMLDVIDEFTQLDAWRSGSTAGSGRRTSSTCCRTSSSSGACRATSGRTTALSSSPRRRGSGSRPQAAKTAFIEPGSPWENGYCESFNSKLRDELLNGEIFYSLAEARGVVETWRRHYNTKRPHSSLGYRPPAPEVMQWPAAPAGPASPATPAVAPDTRHALRLRPDHPIGAGHTRAG